MSAVKPTYDLDFARELDFSQILTNPILDIAARFWEEDRYEAFRTCYRSMRRIDDLVDDRKAGGEHISEGEIAGFREAIASWLEAARSGKPVNAFMGEFFTIRDRYRIPLWPWERLCRAMMYDLEHTGFAGIPVFLRYAEGAAVAPASVFMHLCGVRQSHGNFEPPVFDVRKAARPLALFSYFVHIIRDFEKDQRARLNYFADSLVAECGMTLDDLVLIAENGKPTAAFRMLMRRYVDIADRYRNRSRRMLDGIARHLAPRYQLSLEIIYGLYCQIFQLIDPEAGQFTTAATNPQPAQVQARIRDIVDAFQPKEA